MTPFPRAARACGVLALLAAVGPPVRADQIDAALVRDAAGVTKAVRDLGAKSVAVLKFQVRVGSAAPTFDAGTLGADMARRIENLLVLTNTPDAPEVEVLTRAGEEAAKQAREGKEAFDWTTPAGRTKLFARELPVVWDANRKRPADAFVTGTVRVAADLKTLAVELVGFTRADPTVLRPLRTLGDAEPIRTDRSVLTAVGRSFAVPTRVVTARGGDLRVVNEIAAAEARERVEKASAALPGPVHLQIFYDETEVTPKPGRDGEFRVPTPKAGQKVRFRMTNTGPDPVAALLTVNGRNTLALNGAAEDLGSPAARPDEFQLWVLNEQNKPFGVSGFLTNLDGTHVPFSVLSEEASVRAYDALSSTYAGKIQMTVFGKAPTVAAPVAGEKPTLKEEWPEVAAATPPSTKGMPKPTSKEPAPTTAKSADPEPGKRSPVIDDDAVRELADGHAAGALSVRLPLGETGDLAKAQVALKRGLGINRKADGTLYLPPKTLGMVVAGPGEQGGAGTKRIPFAHDPAPIANVVIGYYAPDAQ